MQRRMSHRPKSLSGNIMQIFGEPSTPVEPGKRALDDPAACKQHKSFGAIGALDDFSFPVMSSAS
jgi:hypothetical protein